MFADHYGLIPHHKPFWTQHWDFAAKERLPYTFHIIPSQPGSAPRVSYRFNETISRKFMWANMTPLGMELATSGTISERLTNWADLTNTLMTCFSGHGCLDSILIQWAHKGHSYSLQYGIVSFNQLAGQKLLQRQQFHESDTVYAFQPAFSMGSINFPDLTYQHHFTMQWVAIPGPNHIVNEGNYRYAQSVLLLLCQVDVNVRGGSLLLHQQWVYTATCDHKGKFVIKWLLKLNLAQNRCHGILRKNWYAKKLSIN